MSNSTKNTTFTKSYIVLALFKPIILTWWIKNEGGIKYKRYTSYWSVITNNITITIPRIEEINTIIKGEFKLSLSSNICKEGVDERCFDIDLSF